MSLVLVSCSSDDSAGPAAGSNTTTTSAATTTTTATTATTATTTTTTIGGGVPDDVTETASTEPDPDEESDITTTTADDPDGDRDAAECLVGAWLLDGPQWVANSTAHTGEAVQYGSGSYIYTFSADGTFEVAVDDFNIIIEGEDEPVRVASNGSEQGTWTVVSEPADVAIRFDNADPPDLPHVLVATTNVSVSETGFVGGQTIPFGEVDQDQGLDGIGPIDCDDGTMVIRGTVPLPIDYPFTRM